MMKLNRTYAPKALSKTNKEFKTAIAGMNTKEAYDFYKSHKRKYCYNTAETKLHFRKMNQERCSFCTKLIQDFDDAMTVEHIQLKKDYPKKTFQWSNLLCACATCNTKRSARAHDPTKYLDPSKIENIENYFCFWLDGMITVNKTLTKQEQAKAEYMIRLYQLNRIGLVCKRREFMRDLISDDVFYNKLKKLDKSSQNIIFLSVFTYYRRCKEENGE